MQRKKALVIMQGFSFGRFFWLLQITGDQNSPDEGQIFRTVRLSFLAERSLFTHRAAPAPEVVF